MVNGIILPLSTYNQYFTKIELKGSPKTGELSLRRPLPCFRAFLFRDLLIMEYRTKRGENQSNKMPACQLLQLLVSGVSLSAGVGMNETRWGE
jgi:hypothetical protein